MTAQSDLQRLLTWLSPAFPVGAFAWSAGLESAIVSNTVHDRLTTGQWVGAVLTHGGLRTDAVLLSHAYRAASDPDELRELADLYLALTPARERHEETTITGASFIAAAKAWPTPALDRLPQPCPYPIALGVISAGHAISLEATLLGYLTAAVHGQISVAVRLVPIGQSDGLAIMAELEPVIAATATLCQHAARDDIGAVAYAADIAQMTHETLTTRIFRS